MNRREHCLLPGEVIFIRRRMQCHLVQAECEFPNRNSNWDHIFKAAETTFQCASRHTLQNNRHHMEEKKSLCSMEILSFPCRETRIARVQYTSQYSSRNDLHGEKEKKTTDRMYPPAQGRGKKGETGTIEYCEETPRMKNYAHREKRDKTVVNKQSTKKRAGVKVS
ncbi:hypothetical protein NPIL_544221 [Nephila pilipes]|uniref:Uncharacterized protein n=1 Tax=Nephila pilipes TaxID=299642 RepID=A0A8X6U4K9_NEPPI|nr:hypothetical protein NPIL_544221 [Nephila pilipes]